MARWLLATGLRKKKKIARPSNSTKGKIPFGDESHRALSLCPLGWGGHLSSYRTAFKGVYTYKEKKTINTIKDPKNLKDDSLDQGPISKEEISNEKKEWEEKKTEHFWNLLDYDLIANPIWSGKKNHKKGDEDIDQLSKFKKRFG